MMLKSQLMDGRAHTTNTSNDAMTYLQRCFYMSRVLALSLFYIHLMVE